MEYIYTGQHAWPIFMRSILNADGQPLYISNFNLQQNAHMWHEKNKPAYQPTYSKNYAIYIATNILHCITNGVNKKSTYFINESF